MSELLIFKLKYFHLWFSGAATTLLDVIKTDFHRTSFLLPIVNYTCSWKWEFCIVRSSKIKFLVQIRYVRNLVEWLILKNWKYFFMIVTILKLIWILPAYLKQHFKTMLKKNHKNSSSDFLLPYEVSCIIKYTDLVQYVTFITIWVRFSY